MKDLNKFKEPTDKEKAIKKIMEIHMSHLYTKEQLIGLGWDACVKAMEKPKKEYGKPEINEVTAYLKSKVIMDGTISQNRQYCNLLIRKIRKEFPRADVVQSIEGLIDVALTDDFHAKNLTGFKYLYYNMSKINNLAKEQIKTVGGKKEVVRMEGNYLKDHF